MYIIYITHNTRICRRRRGNFRDGACADARSGRPSVSVRRCTGRHARAAAAGTPLDGARSPAELNDGRRSASHRGAAHAGDVAPPLDLSINPLGRRRRTTVSRPADGALSVAR